MAIKLIKNNAIYNDKSLYL